MALEINADRSEGATRQSDARKTAAREPIRIMTMSDEPEMLARLRAVTGSAVDLTALSSEREDDDVAGDLVLFLSSADSPWQRVRRLAAGEMPVLVIAARWTEDGEQRALESGAIGYLGLDVPPSTLTRAIHGALKGQAVFRRRALGRWLRPDFVELNRQKQTPRLTRRQQQVASLLTTGAADKEIATSLGIAVATVQKHVSKLLRVVGAANRAAAVWFILTGTDISDGF